MEVTTRRVQQRCPICEGHGLVPAGFYHSVPGHPYMTTSTGPERCKNCRGSGVVYVTETDTEEGKG